MKILGVITARGGSKGVPRKNLKELCGKALLEYTIDSAIHAITLSRIILSTDDPEIAEAGYKYGVDIPFMRPAELAKDDTPTLPVLQHAVRILEEKGEKYDAVCLLQPTNPLRTSVQIDACSNLLINQEADSVVTITPIPHNHNPYWAYSQREDGALYLCMGGKEPIPRRQLLPQTFYRDGTIYITRRDVLIMENSLYGTRLMGYVLNTEESVCIDSYDDLAKAERYLSK